MMGQVGSEEIERHADRIDEVQASIGGWLDCYSIACLTPEGEEYSAWVVAAHLPDGVDSFGRSGQYRTLAEALDAVEAAGGRR